MNHTRKICGCDVFSLLSSLSDCALKFNYSTCLLKKIVIFHSNYSSISLLLRTSYVLISGIVNANSICHKFIRNVVRSDICPISNFEIPHEMMNSKKISYIIVEPSAYLMLTFFHLSNEVDVV